MYYRGRPSASRLAWFALIGCGLGLSLGCNPTLVGNLGGSTIPDLNPPNGYIMILLMNQTTVNVLTDVQVVKKNGASKTWTITAAPGLFYALAIHPWDEGTHPQLTRYYRALAQRPSFAKVIADARPYRHLFPLPWPADFDRYH